MADERINIYFKKVVFGITILSMSIVLIGCGNKKNTAEPEQKMPSYDAEDKVGGNKHESADAVVLHTVMMSKYLIFEATDFPELYVNGDCFSDGIDKWTKLSYEEAEKDFARLGDEITGLGSKYIEDSAFVKLALGCVQLERAEYKEAYDNILEAYVTFEDRYGVGSYYHEAAAIALCNYYYAIGDYDGCTKEIQRIRDNIDYESMGQRSVEIEVFIDVALKNIEADVAYDRGELINSYNLYVENIQAVQDALALDPDNGLLSALKIDLAGKLGDAVYLLGTDYAETSVKFFDLAITTIDKYTGDYAVAKKASIMSHKAYRIANFVGFQDEAVSLMDEAIKMQDDIYGYDGTYPGLVETHRLYADMLGFVTGDMDAAIKEYETALSISTKEYGVNHPQTAKVYESMGRFYGNVLMNFEKSISLYNDGIEICRNLLIEDSMLMASMELQIAGAYKLSGDASRSEQYLDSANRIYEKLGVHLMTMDEAGEENKDGNDDEDDG